MAGGLHGTGAAGAGPAGSSEAARKLREAEQLAGPKVVKEIEAAQKREAHAASEPAVETAEGLVQTGSGRK